MADPNLIVENYLARWQFIRWADKRMLIAAGTVLDHAEYFRDRGISAGSVHALLLHMMSGQVGWLKLWMGNTNSLPDSSAESCQSLAAIEKTWPLVHDAVEKYLMNLQSDQLDEPRTFVRRGVELILPLRDTITHMLDHCCYHRGQLNTLVKLAGGKRVWLSYWVYSLSLHPQPSGAKDSDFLFA